MVLMPDALPLLPTTVVGSHGRPGWLWLAREALAAGRLGATDVAELLEDATELALRDQERAGVVDVKAFKAESADQVAARIRLRLRHVEPRKLWLSPDCGFWETPRGVCRRKLEALAAGARQVRRELGG
jgi:methionine synthase II (cobalamin-independent)